MTVSVNIVVDVADPTVAATVIAPVTELIVIPVMVGAIEKVLVPVPSVAVMFPETLERPNVVAIFATPARAVF